MLDTMKLLSEKVSQLLVLINILQNVSDITISVATRFRVYLNHAIRIMHIINNQQE